MIKVEAVSKSYGELKAVDGVSFAVNRDEIVGFVGPNGAGKSTVLKMLATYLRPSAGRLEVDGLDTVADSLEVRRRIGYLSGDTPLYPDMRVDKFLRFVAKARGLAGQRLKDRFDGTVELCGIEAVLAQRIDQCSTGFRQRVGLAAAMVHDPAILLLDEPTHGFDPLQVLAFRDMLRRLRPGRAILFSTHITSDVEAISDRVLIIHQGRLLAEGPLPRLAEDVQLPDANLETVFAHLVRATAEVRHD